MREQSYAEFKGLPVIDWRSVCEHYKGDTYSVSELGKHNDQASHWHTCAVGQLSSRIPRRIHGCPANGDLLVLGVRFAIAFEDGKYDKAIETINEIEAIAANLLLEE